MKYSIPILIKQINVGENSKFIFFWGHQPNKNGSIGASCFSQWWISPFIVSGITYTSSEHWMMAKKAELFANDKIVQEILLAKTPAEAKKLGRLVTGFIPEVWENNKFDIVKEGTLHKFSQNKDLKGFLLTTGRRIIVEASPLDPIWGIGLPKDHKDAEKPENWKGENLLGFALMEVRDELTK